MTPLRVLFLGPGRATEGTAMGHARVFDAIETGVRAAPGVPLEYRFAQVPPFALWERIVVRRLPRLPDGGRWTLRWHLLRSLGARRIVEGQMRHAPPDLVHVTTDYVTLLMSDLHRRVRVVPSLDITTYDWLRMIRLLPPEGPMPGELARIVDLERRALRRAPLTIAWTDTVARRTRELFPDATVSVLHPGLDAEAFRPREGLRDPGPQRALFVGGRFTQKGGADLVAALAPALDAGRAELDVVTTEEVTPRRGLRVHRLAAGSDSLIRLYQRADVFALPTSLDAVPWVVLEAMACGVPVVSTRVGSIPELLDNNAGFTVQAGDVDGLRTALETLMTDDPLRASMGQAARKRVEERFDARKNTRDLLNLLRGVA